MKVITLTCLLALSVACQATDISTAPKSNQNSPQKQVDKFLQGMRISELPEGKAIIADTMWPQWGTLPILLDYETIYEGMFDTDIPGLRGYKRLLRAKLKSKAGTPLEERCLVVAYPRHKDGKWLVLVFSDETDVDGAIAYGEKQLGVTLYSADQYNWRFVALWYAAAGRLKDALTAYDKAYQLHKKDPSQRAKDSDFAPHAETIKAIIGQDRNL